MVFMPWKDSYATNVKECDAQHQRLVGMINELFDAMSQGKGKEALGNIINGLADYAAYHFGTEERLMKQYNYPEYERHKAEHDRFTQQVVDFKKKFEDGSALLTKDVLKFLSDWLNGHILVIDKKYGPFLNEKGVY